ncbi:MAG: PIG-L deacetylase family protein [Promethearchaeota archaeon]
MQKVAMIIVPHEDDMEILGFHAVAALIKAGFKIIEIVMTDGCFGLAGTKKSIPFKPEFAGSRLRKIRKKEVECAARAYGKNEKGEPHVEVIIMGYADGFLPFNKRSVKKLKDLILKYKPIITIGMDPFFAMDHHHDHLNTGRNYFFALRSIKPELRPKRMYYIQSWKNDVYVPLGSLKLHRKVLNCHKSQLTPLKIKFVSRVSRFLHLYIYYNGKVQKCAGLRTVSFEYKHNILKSLKNRMLYAISFNLVKTTIYNYMNLYKPVPKVGDNKDLTDTMDIDNRNENNLAEFYFGKKYKNKRVKILEKQSFI